MMIAGEGLDDSSLKGVLYRVAAVHLHPLQSVLNPAARIVLKLRKFDQVSISKAIRNKDKVHWLPIDQ